MKEKEEVENTEEENSENKVIIDRCRSSIPSLCFIFFDTYLAFFHDFPLYITLSQYYRRSRKYFVTFCYRKRVTTIADTIVGRGLTILEGIQRRSFEPIYKIVTKRKQRY